MEELKNIEAFYFKRLDVFLFRLRVCKRCEGVIPRDRKVISFSPKLMKEEKTSFKKSEASNKLIINASI